MVTFEWMLTNNEPKFFTLYTNDWLWTHEVVSADQLLIWTWPKNRNLYQIWHPLGDRTFVIPVISGLWRHCLEIACIENFWTTTFFTISREDLLLQHLTVQKVTKSQFYSDNLDVK
jgi:hypothetical protein